MSAISPKVAGPKLASRLKIRVGSVSIEAGMPRIAGMPKLPMPEMKAIAPPAINPGAPSGSTMSRKTRNGPAPASRAASMPSRGLAASPTFSARKTSGACCTPRRSAIPESE